MYGCAALSAVALVTSIFLGLEAHIVVAASLFFTSAILTPLFVFSAQGISELAQRKSSILQDGNATKFISDIQNAKNWKDLIGTLQFRPEYLELYGVMRAQVAWEMQKYVLLYIAGKKESYPSIEFGIFKTSLLTHLATSKENLS
ncbi:MAG: hypothetical protein S4CHLAM123_00600 [Chlamydiales bacterium]|nr:hypothetical protein [Chlamydiales bacterium]